MKKDIIIGVLLIMLGFVVGLLCRPEHFRDEVKMLTDTLVVVDTHIIEKPVIVERTIKDSLLVAVHDTIRIKDTLYMPILIETKTYKGEDYFAEISGYKANLERIEVYPKNVVISKTETTIQTVTNRNSLTIGIEPSYCTTLSIPIYLEYERMLHENFGLNAGLFYDLPVRQFGAYFGIFAQIGW